MIMMIIIFKMIKYKILFQKKTKAMIVIIRIVVVLIIL
jgi:hypothetical protein